MVSDGFRYQRTAERRRAHYESGRISSFRRASKIAHDVYISPETPSSSVVGRHQDFRTDGALFETLSFTGAGKGSAVGLTEESVGEWSKATLA